jgi:MGT family glycosyltransferase
MARFLFAVWPFAGCVNPSIAVARCLDARGHSIAFYTGRSPQRSIEAHGWTAFPFRQLAEERVNDLVYSSDSIGASWRRPRKLRPRLRALFVDTVPGQLADLEAVVAGWEPHAIVTDPAMWAPFLLVRELHRLPVAILSYACGCMLPGPGAPPVGLGLPLPRGAWGRWRNRIVGAAVDLFLADMRRAARVMRRRHGLSSFDGPVISLAARLPLYLVPSCREFDYSRTDLPPSVEYVGPLQWYPELPAPAWLDELATWRPLVHATEGTLHVQDPFLLRAAADALADEPLDAVLTTCGRAIDELGLGRHAANVRVVDWVNHSQLLPRTSVMITTAGGGTVMAGLAAGVPMVVVPTEWDKAENAQRVVESGAGVRIAPSACSATTLRRAVREVLENPDFRRNAQRLSQILGRQGGPERAAALLEQMVSDSASRTGSKAEPVPLGATV